ncbi:MAG TPA: DUF885 domain-containing protein, partial [Candidatus Eisenbacteria bacterium]|nr:DUF885 domain-containing protein [Candidatus Eisenbacteria bacterium]
MSDRATAAGATTADATEGAAAERLRALAEAFWEDHLRAHPMWATIMGDRRYDDRLPDLSPDAIRANQERLWATLAAASALNAGQLTQAEQVTRQMLIDEVGGQLAALGTGLHEWTVDPLEGPHVSLLNLPEYQSIEKPVDGERLTARWRAIDTYLDATIDGLRRAKASGRVAVRTPVDRTIDELRHLEALAPERWKLAAPADVPHDGWTAAEEAAFADGLRAAVREVAVPAFRRYREVLEDEIRPAARSADLPGLLHVPGGADAYRAMIRSHTSLDLDPAEIHATGLAEIEEIDGQFVALGRRLLATPDLPTTLHALRTDRSLRFETADEVFRTAQASLERAAAAIPSWFGRLPKAPCEVVRIPEHAEVHQTIAYYAWPAMDGSRAGRYYINLYAPETRPRYEAETLAFHESIPGHHLQIAIAQELDGLPAFQRALGSNAFSEGWGLYTERLAEEMGLYSGEMDRFGILSFDAWRAGRLVVDTGMHAFGWT